jgi:ADP-dependent NAD(P)H-hydrate dehydratase / NAD(P)H-hydrate epimerase
LSSSDLPTLSSSQVKRVDEVCAERFGIPTDWLMEAAGWRVATFVRKPAVVVCGVGNNAGDGLAAARHLHRWGRLVRVCCVDPARLRGQAALELEALRRQGVEPSTQLRLTGARTIVDAIFGTGLSRPPEGTFAEWIRAINVVRGDVVSVDVPSGLDAESGVAYSPIVNATTTIALGLPKPGLMRLPGDVYLADIGVPLEAYAAIGVKVPAHLVDAPVLRL